MSIHPASRSTRPTPPRPADGTSRDLTVNKVVAGAGAAATSAVLGSFFGAAGTVAGAALGSVASTVATTIYQRSLDRTRDSLAARIRPMRGGPDRRSSGRPTVPTRHRASEDETVRLRVEPEVSAPPRRRWLMWTGATVLVFVIGLLAVTGIEWAKGSTLTGGDTGTSVGRVFGPDHSAPAPSTGPAGRPADPTTSPEPSTGRPTPSVPGLGSDGSGSNGPGSGGAGGSQVPLLPGLVGG